MAGPWEAVSRVFGEPLIKLVQRLEDHDGSGVGGVEGRDVNDAVFHFGVEEARFGPDAFALAGEEAVFVIFVGREVGDVVEHPAEFFVELLGEELARGERGVALNEGEAGGELAVAEARLVKALAGAGATVEHVEVFAFAVFGGKVGACFFKAVVEDFEVGFDQVGDIAQQRGSTLLAGFFDEDAGGGDPFTVHGGSSRSAGFGSHFVAADIGEANGLENVKAVDDPADLGFPVDGFKDAAGGGRGDDIVAHALDLHFGPGEAGEIAGEMEFDAEGHESEAMV